MALLIRVLLVASVSQGTCSLLMMEGGMEKKYPAFTPSMATEGFPSKAWSRAFSTPEPGVSINQTLFTGHCSTKCFTRERRDLSNDRKVHRVVKILHTL